MAHKPNVHDRDFEEAWPVVLTAMRIWIREQVAFTGGARRFEIELSLSQGKLLAEKGDGARIQPALDEFLAAIRRNHGIEIPRPSEGNGLHLEGPHRISFKYWR